jgi:GT2 family glycosyltransferase
MLVDRELWDRLGGFDKVFFMYGEEADFCMRAGKLGARPTFTPQATIIHYGGASQQHETDKIVRGLSARAELIARHFSGLDQSIGLFVNALLPLVRALAYGTAARLSSNPMLLTRAATWRDVWLKRPVWRAGFSKAAAGAGG